MGLLTIAKIVLLLLRTRLGRTVLLFVLRLAKSKGGRLALFALAQRAIRRRFASR